MYLKSKLPFLKEVTLVALVHSSMEAFFTMKTDTFVYIMQENAALGMHLKFYFQSTVLAKRNVISTVL